MAKIFWNSSLFVQKSALPRLTSQTLGPSHPLRETYRITSRAYYTINAASVFGLYPVHFLAMENGKFEMANVSADLQTNTTVVGKEPTV